MALEMIAHEHENVESTRPSRSDVRIAFSARLDHLAVTATRSLLSALTYDSVVVVVGPRVNLGSAPCRL